LRGKTFQLFKLEELHQKDKALLENIQSYLGVGNIYINQGHLSLQFKVQSVKDLVLLLKHFEKYPLLTQKRSDYELFKHAIRLMEQKEHLTSEGLAKIVALKASLNMGLSPGLKAAFPHVIPVTRPSGLEQKIPNPDWLAGFTSGVLDGCFMIKTNNSSSPRLGLQVQLEFNLSQHSRDERLMRSLIDYFDCGSVYFHREKIDYRIRKFSDLTDKVIPLFNKYPIIGVKSKDFADFCKAAELIKNKAHLSQDGLDQIRKIKAGMNRGRK